MSAAREPFDLEIHGMHCSACVRRVSVALQRIPGVSLGAVGIGRVSGEIDSEEASRADVVEAVRSLGFSVEAEGA